MGDPKITVIIPTRERCDVLQMSLRTVIQQDYENLEILVSDNFSSDETEDVVRAAADSRVKYINTGQRLSMSGNWEFALSHVQEGWVTIIGDDDGILPSSLRKVASLVRETRVSAIRSSVCSYSWPSLSGQRSGSLSVPLWRGYEVRDSRIWLGKVLAGKAAYSQLPMLYNGGYVSVDVLLQAKRKLGTVYRSCIPDVYSAVSIASLVDRYVYLHEPLAINGASRHSTGTSIFVGKGTTANSPAARFASEGNIPFHADVPLQFDGSFPTSLQVLVYESYLQSAPLRARPSESMHDFQLGVILGAANSEDESLHAWGRQFAAQHELDFDAIRRRANRRRLLNALAEMPSRIAAAIGMFHMGSPLEPIRDVYEASIAAMAVRSVGPGYLQGSYRMLRRLLARSGLSGKSNITNGS